MPGFPYHEIDEIEPELDHHVQVRPGAYNINTPVKPILASTPLYSGILQIFVGLITAASGGIDVFLVPVLINAQNGISLSYINCWGAALWSGFVLVLAGSCAVRAHIKPDRTEALRFYGVSLFAFLVVLACIIVSQVSYTKEWTNMDPAFAGYYIYSLLSTISSLIGLLLLMITVAKYFHRIVLQDGKMLQMFVICCFPCCGNKDSDDLMDSV